jgi:hypothetical protein
MEINFTDIINKHLNKPCLIVGPGPTMANFPYDKFKGVIISVSDSAIRGKDLFTPNYWVSSNSHFPVPEIDLHLEIINSFSNTTFLFAQTELYGLLWDKSQNYLNKNLKINWLMYDERHFNGYKCVPNKKCCSLISNREGFFTIQELVSKIYKHVQVAKQGGTVFEYAFCLSLILGCNPTYIQGIDIPGEDKKKLDIKNNLGFLDNLQKIFGNIFKYQQNMSSNYFEQGDLGQKYFINTNYKKELVDLYSKTFNIVGKRAKKISRQNYLFFTIRIKNFFTRLIKYFFIKNEYRQNMPGFSDSMDRILYNLNIYSAISHKNNKDVFYLSPKSNLSKVKNIKFLNIKNLKI